MGVPPSLSFFSEVMIIVSVGSYIFFWLFIFGGFVVFFWGVRDLYVCCFYAW